jgi:hypothetical protein
MPSKKGGPKTPTKVSKPAEDPDSASNRIKSQVKDTDAELAAEKAAKEEADRAEAALRDEELQRRLSQDGSGRSDSSQTGDGLFGLNLSGSADNVPQTRKQIADLLKSSLANVPAAWGSQEVSDPVIDPETVFPEIDLR